jgi:hypothetical protein
MIVFRRVDERLQRSIVDFYLTFEGIVTWRFPIATTFVRHVSLHLPDRDVREH